MNLLCYLFGHRSTHDTFGGGEYGRIDNWESGPDGVGRVHVDLFGECPRCGRTIRVGRFHRPGGPFVFDHAAGKNRPAKTLGEHMDYADGYCIEHRDTHPPHKRNSLTCIAASHQPASELVIYDKPRAAEDEWRAQHGSKKP